MRRFASSDITCGRCGVVRCGAEWSLDRAWSAALRDYDLWYVWAGRGRMELRSGDVLDIEPGLCVVMRPGGLYLATQDRRAPLGVTFVHFSLRSHARAVDLPPEHRLVDDPAWIDATLRRVVDLHVEGRRSACATELIAAVLNDLAQPARPSLGGTDRRHHEVVDQAVARVRQSIADAPRPAELARGAGYSLDHFTRIFRQIRGQSPQEFIVAERIRAAQGLLTESSLTVTQIADALGYASVYYFSRQFRQVTGRPPTAARRG